MIADEDLAVDLKVQQLLWNMILRIAQAYALKPQTHSQTSPKADLLAYTYTCVEQSFLVVVLCLKLGLTVLSINLQYYR